MYVVLANDVILCGASLDSRLDSLYRVAIVRQRSKCSMPCQLTVYPIGPHIKCFCLFWFHGAMDDSSGCTVTTCSCYIGVAGYGCPILTRPYCISTSSCTFMNIPMTMTINSAAGDMIFLITCARTRMGTLNSF